MNEFTKAIIQTFHAEASDGNPPEKAVVNRPEGDNLRNKEIVGYGHTRYQAIQDLIRFLKVETDPFAEQYATVAQFLSEIGHDLKFRGVELRGYGQGNKILQALEAI